MFKKQLSKAAMAKMTEYEIYRFYNPYKPITYQKKYYEKNKVRLKQIRDNKREEINRKAREYYKNNIEYRREYNRNWNKKQIINNPGVKAAKQREYRKKNIERCREYSRKYYQLHKKDALAKRKIYLNVNKDKINAAYKKWLEKNPDYQKNYYKKYYTEHKAEYLERNRKNAKVKKQC